MTDRSEHARARTDLVDEEDEDVRGPHLWLNWQGMLAGQPARSSSYGQTILVHPLWEEWALYSDADISGELDFGPYKLLMTLSGGGRVGRPVQQLVLRHDDHLFEAPPRVGDDALDLRGWTGGDLGDQMAALLSLALGRRVRSGGVVRQGFEPGDPLGRPTAPRHRLPALVEPTAGPMLPGIAEPAQVQSTAKLLDAYARLDPQDAAALTRAAGQYADALWWADADPRIAGSSSSARWRRPPTVTTCARATTTRSPCSNATAARSTVGSSASTPKQRALLPRPSPGRCARRPSS